MKIELSGEEKAIIILYLSSFEEYYKNEKRKDISKLFRKVKHKFTLNSDKINAKRGDWSFIVRALLEGKKLISNNLIETDKIENEEEKKETKDSMNYAINNINSALKKIQEVI